MTNATRNGSRQRSGRLSRLGRKVLSASKMRMLEHLPCNQESERPITMGPTLPPSRHKRNDGPIMFARCGIKRDSPTTCSGSPHPSRPICTRQPYPGPRQLFRRWRRLACRRSPHPRSHLPTHLPQGVPRVLLRYRGHRTANRMMRGLAQRLRRMISTICLMPRGPSQKRKTKFAGGRCCENRSKTIRGKDIESASHSPT